jgi:hypothetical protein
VHGGGNRALVVPLAGLPPHLRVPSAKLLVSASQELSCLPAGAVSRCLDALGGHVVKRIRSQNHNAITQIEDLVDLLGAYAECGHVSVVAPELLRACGHQVRGV